MFYLGKTKQDKKNIYYWYRHVKQTKKGSIIGQGTPSREYDITTGLYCFFLFFLWGGGIVLLYSVAPPLCFYRCCLFCLVFFCLFVFFCFCFFCYGFCFFVFSFFFASISYIRSALQTVRFFLEYKFQLISTTTSIYLKGNKMVCYTSHILHNRCENDPIITYINKTYWS